MVGLGAGPDVALPGSFAARGTGAPATPVQYYRRKRRTFGRSLSGWWRRTNDSWRLLLVAAAVVDLGRVEILRICDRIAPGPTIEPAAGAFQTKLCATRGPKAPRCDRAFIKSPRSAADLIDANLTRRRRWSLWIPAPRLRGDKLRGHDEKGAAPSMYPRSPSARGRALRG